MVARNRQPVLSIPQTVQGHVAAVAAYSSGPERRAALTKAQKMVSLQVPGAVNTGGKGRGADLGRAGIRAVFAKHF